MQWIRKLAGRYNSMGVEGLSDRRQSNPGGKPLLDEIQMAQLLQVIQQPAADGGLWNGRKVADWMSDQLERPVSAMARLGIFKSNGISFEDASTGKSTS